LDAAARTSHCQRLPPRRKLIGCSLPPAITHIYSAVANGGFGPGYGLVGIGGGRPGFSDWRGQRHCEDEYDVLRQDAGIIWPAHLLPLCDWGCAIYQCVDVSQPDAPIFTAFGEALYDDPPHAVMSASWTFVGWLRAWADGEDLRGGPEHRNSTGVAQTAPR
jgi:hypothetical protein